MKSALFLPFALLLGLVIGGWAPKEELSAAKRQVADLTAKLAARDKDTRLDAFTRMIKIPERAKSPAPATRRADAPVASASSRPATNAVAQKTDASHAAPIGASEAATPADAATATPEDLRARIDEAKELWKTRVDIARAQWIDRLKLTPEEAARFDDALNTMNENLYHSMQRLADGLSDAEALTPESGVRAFSEMTEALVVAYDDLATVVPDAKRGEASKMELTDFIDPGVAEPLIAVQDKLQNVSNDRRSRLRFRR